jgi:hypothetical protein
MADSALFIGWGAPVRGREQNASKVFGEAVELWTKLQADGTLESWSAYFLEPHGGDMQGFFLLHGEREKLALVRTSEAFDNVILRADTIIEGLGVVGAATGGRIESQMGRFMQNAAELG